MSNASPPSEPPATGKPVGWLRGTVPWVLIGMLAGLVGTWFLAGDQRGQVAGMSRELISNQGEEMDFMSPLPGHVLDHASEAVGTTDTRSSPRRSLADRLLDDLPEGSLVFNVPEKARLGEEIRIAMLLSPQLLESELMPMLRGRLAVGTGGLQKDDPLSSARVKMDDLMEATLAGSAFEIQPLHPERQLVRYSEPVEWAWSVVPRKAGRNPLQLTLQIIVPVSGESAPIRLGAFERQIEVEISTWGRLRNLVEPLGSSVVANVIAGLIVAGLTTIAALAMRRIRRNRRSRDTSPDPD